MTTATAHKTIQTQRNIITRAIGLQHTLKANFERSLVELADVPVEIIDIASMIERCDELIALYEHRLTQIDRRHPKY